MAKKKRKSKLDISLFIRLYFAPVEVTGGGRGARPHCPRDSHGPPLRPPNHLCTNQWRAEPTQLIPFRAGQI